MTDMAETPRDLGAGHSPEIHGRFDPAFQPLVDAFKANFHARGEVGASLCLSVGGKTVVDIWGGLADAKAQKPWQHDTISTVFSCTKAATALCAHILIDRGALDLDAPVARYWPEFACNGKEDTTVRMLLNHSAGLPAYRRSVKPRGFTDWSYMTGLLAAQAPFWSPGTSSGYHMTSFGWLVGEVVRRVSGQSLGRFFRQEIGDPLGVDFWIGLPKSQQARVAVIVPYDLDPDAPITPFLNDVMTDPASIAHRALLNSGGFAANKPEYYPAEIGGAGGIANARALAGMFAPLVAGKGSFLSPERITAMRALSSQNDDDETLRMPTRFGEGFMLAMRNPDQPSGSRLVIGDSAFGHVGMGGSIGLADPEAEMALGYTMNRLGGGILLNARGQTLVDAAYDCLEKGGAS